MLINSKIQVFRVLAFLLLLVFVSCVSTNSLVKKIDFPEQLVNERTVDGIIGNVKLITVKITKDNELKQTIFISYNEKGEKTGEEIQINIKDNSIDEDQSLVFINKMIAYNLYEKSIYKKVKKSEKFLNAKINAAAFTIYAEYNLELIKKIKTKFSDLLKKEYEVTYDKNGLLLSKKVFFYDKNGKIIEKKTFDISNNIIYQEILTYNDYMISKIEIKDLLKNNIFSKCYTIDTKNYLIKENVNDETGKIIDEILYTYNKDGNLKKIDQNGICMDYEYKYFNYNIDSIALLDADDINNGMFFLTLMVQVLDFMTMFIR